MDKIKLYFDKKLVDCKKLFVDVAFDVECEMSFDSHYNNYSISKIKSGDYSNAICGSISDYRYKEDKIIRYDNIEQNIKKLITSEDFMDYAKSEMDYTTEKIEWKSYSF